MSSNQMANTVEAGRINRTRRDSVDTLLSLLGKLRRRTSRLDTLGILPEEVSVRIFGHILNMEEELKPFRERR